MKVHRRSAIIARWMDVIAYGAIAGLVCYVFDPAVESLSAPLVGLIASVPLWAGLAFWISVGCVLLGSVGRHRWMGLLGTRHLLSFPPLWLGILFAGMTAASINAWWPRDPLLTSLTTDLARATSYFSPIYASILVVVVVMALVAYVAIRLICNSHSGQVLRDPTNGRHPQSGWREQLRNLQSLKQWVQDDSEVVHPGRDLFDHDSIARRIAQRLQDDSRGVTPTMAVVGDRGSGKSTIGRLVEHHLRSNPRMLFVRLSLWPFDSTDAAVRGILGEIIRALGRRVNTLSLTGLPEQYTATVEKLGPWASVLGFFRQSRNPVEIIEHVDRIALATDLRIVVWIEDLERFSGTATMERETAALREEDRLGPIRSLLWLLNECEHISVVVADTTLRSRFDIEKVARFVERVPPLDLDQAGEVIGFLRKECMNGHPKPVIDPVDPDERHKFKPSEPLVRSLRYYLSSRGETDPFDALIDVVRTPRSLKNVLRWTLEVWEQLPGEIDLDHVIAASALRSSYPEVFEFVDDNVHWFRRGFQAGGNNGKDPMQHQAYLAFQEVIAHPPLQVASVAITSLVRFIFPVFPQARVIPDVDRQYLMRPQGLNIRHDWFGAEPVDYWDRYLRCAPVANDLSDQRVLRQIDAWKGNEENDLVSSLIDEKRNSQVEAFLRQFSLTDLVRLLTEVVEREGREGVANWSQFQSPPGGVSVWRMLNRCGVRDSVRVASALEKLLQHLVPSHLPYANFLVHYFCMPSPGPTVSPLTDAHDTARLSGLVHERLLEAFPPGTANALRTALRGANPYLLRNFLHEVKSGCGFTGDLPIEGWEQVATTLLELAEIDPSVGIPIILSFVMSASNRIVDSWDGATGERRQPARVTDYQFQEQVARRLFDWERLHPLLAEQRIPEDIEEWIGQMWSAAKQTICP